MHSLGELTLSHFLPHLGSTFSCSQEGASDILLVLTNADSLARGQGGKVPRREPFSLVFTGPRDVFLPQSVYSLRHPSLGGFDLFLVPIGTNAVASRYEAVFS